MSETDDLVDAIAPVVASFRSLGIRHFVGGSIASSFHGAIRTTMDVDVVCELTEDNILPFIESFNADYYLKQAAELVGAVDLLDRLQKQET